MSDQTYLVVFAQPVTGGQAASWRNSLLVAAITKERLVMDFSQNDCPFKPLIIALLGCSPRWLILAETLFYREFNNGSVSSRKFHQFNQSDKFLMKLIRLNFWSYLFGYTNFRSGLFEKIALHKILTTDGFYEF